MKKTIVFSLLLLKFIGTINGQAPVIQWQKCFGGTLNDDAKSIEPTKDGGYIIAGSSNSNNGNVSGTHGDNDCMIIKINYLGSVEWSKLIGGSESDIAKDIKQTTDNGYIIGGTSASEDYDVNGNHGSYDYWLIKTDSTGAVLWKKCFGGSDYDDLANIQITNDGGIIVAGTSYSNDGDVTGNHGSADCWIVRLDSMGGILWQKSYGGTSYDDVNFIQQTTDGGFIFLSSSSSNNGDVTGNHGGSDYWIVKIDSNGSLLWQKSLGGSNGEYASKVKQTADGGYILAGRSYSNDFDVSGNHGSCDYWIVKLNAFGLIEWGKSLGGTLWETASNIIEYSNGKFIVVGWAESNDGDVSGNHGSWGSDCWIVQLSNTGTIDWQKMYGGAYYDEGSTICKTSDGGLLMAGNSNSTNGDVSGNHGQTDAWIVKINSLVGIQEQYNYNTVTIYPNPSKGFFNFSDLSNSDEIEIYDALGNLILKEKGTIVNLTDYNNGIYFYKINGKHFYSGKLIKQ